MKGMETTSLLMTVDCDVTVDEQRNIAQDPKASIEEYCCNFLENSLFSPVFFVLKMAE